MDDTQKVTQDTTNIPSSQQQQDDQSHPKSQGISQPISTPSREAGPASSLSSETLASLSTPEMIISPELHKETGAEAVSEVPSLTPEDAKAGIVHAKESTPIVPVPTPSTIVLPMQQQQAQQTVKMHRKVKDSLFWFAMLIARQWQIAQRRPKKEVS